MKRGFDMKMVFTKFVMILTISSTLLFSKGGNMTLSSPSFKNKEYIPEKYTCSGKNIPPALRWEGYPEETKSFVLIMDDPDAVGGVWNHWIVYDIPVDITNIQEGEVAPHKSKIGKNTNSTKSYVGPCPPKGSGVHGYRFTIYALDVAILNPSGLTKSDIQEAMKEHILDESTLIGNFEKKKKFLFF